MSLYQFLPVEARAYERVDHVALVHDPEHTRQDLEHEMSNEDLTSVS